MKNQKSRSLSLSQTLAKAKPSQKSTPGYNLALRKLKAGTRLCQTEYTIRSLRSKVFHLSSRVAMLNDKLRNRKHAENNYIERLRKRHLKNAHKLSKIKMLAFTGPEVLKLRRILKISHHLMSVSANCKKYAHECKKSLMYFNLGEKFKLRRFLNTDRRRGVRF